MKNNNLIFGMIGALLFCLVSLNGQNLILEGNLGIGTSAPQGKLDIQGGSDVNAVSGGYIIMGDLSGSNIGIDNNEMQARNNGVVSTLLLNREGGNISIGSGVPMASPTPRLDVNGNIFATGSVGIGTPTAAEKLHVEGDALFVPEDESNSSVDLSVKITRTFIDDEFDRHNLKILPQGDLNALVRADLGDINNLWTGVYTQTIDMGTSLGSNKLLLYNAVSSNYGMGVVAGQFRFNIGNPQARYAFHNSSAFNSTEIFTINGNGTFGFNDPNPSHTLSVNGNVSKPGGGSWIVSSDKRLKTNVQKFELGLDIIKKIEPKTFQYNGKLNLPTDEEYVGVIAQELQKVAPFMVSEFEKEGNTYLAVDPSAFDYILINAVKEQQKTIEEKEKRLAEVEHKNAELEARLAQIEILLRNGTADYQPSTFSTTLTDAKLFPNQPNPFTDKTLIRYYIPQGSGKAELRITNLEGKVIKVIPIQASGEGQTILEAQALSAGIYFYSLVLDGQILETKQMVLTK